MEENKILTLFVDTSEAEKGIIRLSHDVSVLKSVAGELGYAFVTAFDPLLVSIQDAQVSIEAMTEELGYVVASIQQLTAPVAASDTSIPENGDISFADSMLEMLISGALSTSLSALIEQAFKALGDSGPKVAAITLAIITAITAIALIWNEYGEEIRAGVSSFLNKVGEAWWNLYGSIISPIMEFIGLTADNLWNDHIKPLWDSLRTAFTSWGECMTTLWTEMEETIYYRSEWHILAKRPDRPLERL